MHSHSKVPWIVLVVIIIVGGSVFYFEKNKNQENGEVCIQVITSARNPQTGEVKEFPTPCDVPEGWDTLEGGGNEQYQVGNETFQKYRNADLGISFDYRISPDGYTFIHQQAENGEPEFVDAFVLMNTREYEEFSTTQIAREGPPTISVVVLSNPQNLEVSDWVRKNPMWSLIELSSPTTLTPKTVGGAPAVQYKAGGLYENDMTVVSNNYRIYIIAGSYLNPQDKIRADYQAVLNSLVFF